MIKRRLVSGILMLILASFELYASVEYYQWAQGNSAIGNDEAAEACLTLFGSYIFYAVLGLVIGIIFVSTCKKRPVKWGEYTMMVVMLVSLSLIPYMAPNTGTEGQMFGFIAFVQVILYAIGAPTRKGYKNFHFVKKNDNDESAIETLGKLKDLLDSGAITQEEFDKEKKKIWK